MPTRINTLGCLILFVSLLGTGVTWSSAGAQDGVGPGCQMRLVRKPIKKTVYCLKRVPYCPHRVPCPLGQCETCDLCQACPKYKNVLLKKEIVVGETCTYECVVDEAACGPANCGK